MAKRIFIFILFTFTIYKFSFGSQNEIKEILKTQTNFSEQQILNITTALEKYINSDNILYNLALLRVKEAIAKKVDYLLFYTTLIKKISTYKIAKILVDEFYPKISKSELEYSIQYLADQIEQGITFYEIIQILKTSSNSNLPVKESLKFLSLINYARKNNISPEVSLEIIKNGISTKKSFQLIKENIIKSKHEIIEKELLKETKEKEIIER
ncbi:MAG: hypothetical protein ABDH23_02965 [Endomicrobiia bacterium]